MSFCLYYGVVNCSAHELAIHSFAAQSYFQNAKARARQEVLCNIYIELEKALSDRMLSKLSELRRAQRRVFKRRMATNDGEIEEVLCP